MSAHALAAEPVHGAAGATQAHAEPGAAHHDAQPVLPASSALGGSMLILILGLFLAAVIVGPVVRYHAPEEPPDVSHDDHGHGVHDAHGHGHDAHGAHGHGH
jgi:hypothetical protein